MTYEDRAQDRVGSLFAGKYRLRRVLGHGGMGAVYGAQHAFTGKHCAVKVLDPSMSSVPGYSARFLREARSAAEIGHPCICDVYDAGQNPDDGSLYLVLELLEGEDLGAAIRRGDLTQAEIVEIGRQVCEGLAAAHARGIVHRDVKPENVFLSRNERGELRVKLLDFGVAKNVRSQTDLFSTQQGQVIGTPFYMAPEQAAGDEVDGRADVWSVGAMLFHALSGRPPFEGTNYNRLILEILSQKPPSLRELEPDLPEWLLRMVDGALVVDRAERWQSAAQMAAGLAARGEVPIGLEWEAFEDATVKTESPFEATGDTIPPVDFKSLTPSGNVDLTEAAAAATASGRQNTGDAPTMAATPSPGRPAADEDSGRDDPTKAQRPVAIQYEQRKVTTPVTGRSDAAVGTPRAWDRAAPSAGRRPGFVVAVVVGGIVAVAAGFGVAWWSMQGGDDEEPIAVPIAPAAAEPDAGTDAGPPDAGPPDAGPSVPAARERDPRRHAPERPEPARERPPAEDDAAEADLGTAARAAEDREELAGEREEPTAGRGASRDEPAEDPGAEP